MVFVVFYLQSNIMLLVNNKKVTTSKAWKVENSVFLGTSQEFPRVPTKAGAQHIGQTSAWHLRVLNVC